MVSSTFATIADAIATQINTRVDLGDATAEASWADWNDELKGGTDLHVDVVPAVEGSELICHGLDGGDYSFDVGVRQRIETRNDDNGRITRSVIDSLVELLEAIHREFLPTSARRGRIETFENAVWKKSEVKACVRQHLQIGQYTGVVRLTFAVTIE